MKYLLTIAIFLTGMFGVTKSFGQNDANVLIEKSKGTWRIPVSKYKQIQDIEYRKREHSFNKTDSSITFVSDSSYEVHSVYKGKVVLLSEDHGEWSITTRCGDYFISYIGLTKPNFSVGDEIETGQLIALVTKDKNEMEYYLHFLLNNLNNSIDPRGWFK